MIRTAATLKNPEIRYRGECEPSRYNIWSCRQELIHYSKVARLPPFELVIAAGRASTAPLPHARYRNTLDRSRSSKISNLLYVLSEEVTIRGSRRRSGQTVLQARSATEIPDSKKWTHSQYSRVFHASRGRCGGMGNCPEMFWRYIALTLP